MGGLSEASGGNGYPSASPRPDMSDATRVVLSYPADLPERARQRLRRPYYRRYLAKTLGRVTPGDTREEFTDIGCCGSQRDVSLRVEAVEGGDRVGPETAVEYAERDACGLADGWALQNDRPAETEQ